MSNTDNTRRGLLKAGAVLTALPFGGISLRGAQAQAPVRSPAKVLDFLTSRM
jgi:hypothetical protein